MKKTGMILALTALCLLMTAGALAVELPPQIRVLREVTGDRRYTNSSLSKKIVTEPLEG